MVTEMAAGILWQRSCQLSRTRAEKLPPSQQLQLTSCRQFSGAPVGHMTIPEPVTMVLARPGL